MLDPSHTDYGIIPVQIFTSLKVVLKRFWLLLLYKTTTQDKLQSGTISAVTQSTLTHLSERRWSGWDATTERSAALECFQEASYSKKAAFQTGSENSSVSFMVKIPAVSLSQDSVPQCVYVCLWGPATLSVTAGHVWFTEADGQQQLLDIRAEIWAAQYSAKPHGAGGDVEERPENLLAYHILNYLTCIKCICVLCSGTEHTKMEYC